MILLIFPSFPYLLSSLCLPCPLLEIKWGLIGMMGFLPRLCWLSGLLLSPSNPNSFSTGLGIYGAFSFPSL